MIPELVDVSSKGLNSRKVCVWIEGGLVYAISSVIAIG